MLEQQAGKQHPARIATTETDLQALYGHEHGGRTIDFSKVPLLHARPRPEDWRRWLDHVGLKRIAGLSGSSFESLGLAIEAAAAGAGIAMAIEGLLAADLAHGRLVRAHPTTRATRRYFVLQYEARLADDPALKTFESRLLDTVRQVA